MATLSIGERQVGEHHPTYFIADISANHDGQLQRAIELIHLAAEAGADAAKFQHFRAPYIVSRYGFENLGRQLSHQAKWKKSVYEVYEDATLPWEWTETLARECQKAGIDFFSTPYDLEAVDMLDPYVPCFKIGSGDITWPEILVKIAQKQKPVLLATGASDLGEVQRAVSWISRWNSQISVMQCNTNYTGSRENYYHIHLNVLKIYGMLYPDYVLGLSDHTPGHAAVLGAVALGARIIEKHFTDDPGREGPDHPFSMTPATWREMVERTRELEAALGESRKFVTPNEVDTVVVQRRCLRAKKSLPAGTILTKENLIALRPAPKDAVMPYEIGRVVGKKLLVPLEEGQHLTWEVIGELVTETIDSAYETALC